MTSSRAGRSRIASAIAACARRTFSTASPGAGRLRVASAVAAAACLAAAVTPGAALLQPPGQPATSGLDRNAGAPFSVSLVPMAPVPIRIGTELGFQLSSNTAGYASLYLIDPVYDVQILAENLPIPAGSLQYPSGGFTLRAAQPVGFNWVLLLVTRQPFEGFSGNDTLTTPVSTALDGRRFVSQLNAATRALPASSWAADEVRIRIVG